MNQSPMINVIKKFFIFSSTDLTLNCTISNMISKIGTIQMDFHPDRKLIFENFLTVTSFSQHTFRI